MLFLMHSVVLFAMVCFLFVEVLVLLGSFQSDVPECSDESGSTNIIMIILCTQC